MAKDRDSGFHSAAGLIRYFDQEDEKALKVPPWIVVALCVGLSALAVLSGAPVPAVDASWLSQTVRAARSARAGTVPAGSGERFFRYGVMGLPFRAGPTMRRLERREIA